MPYKNQSTANISPTSSVGSPTAVRTITMVTSPASGTPAAPMAAAVAVMLRRNKKGCTHSPKVSEPSIFIS